MIKRLRLKFIVINMGIATILLSAILGLVFYFTSANLETESIRMMERIASQPFQMNAPGELGEDVRLPFFTLQLGPHGELLDASGGYYDLSDDAFLGGLAQAAAASPRRLGVLEEYNLRYYRSDAPMSRFLVFADISSERATLDGLRRTCLLIGGLSFLAFLWVSVLLSKWAVRPVERAWQQQRQFLSDASHELKTPLTVILSNAELLEAAPLEDRPARWADNIRSEAGQMKSLVEEMLTLFRAESVRRETAFSEVDLSDVVTDAALRFEPVVFESGRRLLYTIDEGLQVSGDRDALERLTGILLDNAVKYAPQGTDIRLTLTHQDRTACLTVENGGDPIPPEVAAHLFDRFYRADSSRTGTGFGLGLAIARAIAQNHKGNITCRSQEGVNRFSVTLPILRQKEAQ